MGDSSPEPLDELEDRHHRVVRWASVRESGSEPVVKPSKGLRRTGTVPSLRRSIRNNNNHTVSGERLDPFGGHSYLRVPGMASGRTSPSVVSMSSEPESCIDDMRYMQEDDEIDYG